MLRFQIIANYRVKGVFVWVYGESGYCKNSESTVRRAVIHSSFIKLIASFSAAVASTNIVVYNTAYLLRKAAN